MVARIITGVGIGYITSVTPVYRVKSLLLRREDGKFVVNYNNVIWAYACVLDQLRSLFQK